MAAEPTIEARLAESERSRARLAAIVEASLEINSSLELDQLLRNILAVALLHVRAERGTIFLLDEERQELWSRLGTGLAAREIRVPVGRGIAGEVAAQAQSLIIADPYSDTRFNRSFDLATGFRTRSILCVPVLNRSRRVVGVFQLLNRTEGEFSDADVDFLEALSSHAALAIENAQLQMARVEQERMSQQLALARDIQARLLPAAPPQVPGLEVAAVSESCYEIGGDYHDFIAGPAGSLLFAIGDVSGKGVGAALIMSNLQAALRVLAPEVQLAALPARLNALLHQTTRSRQFVTLVLAAYDAGTRRLAYVNAGHTPALLRRAGKVLELEATGIPLGLYATAEFPGAELVLEAGDALLLYTDGISEATAPNGADLGIPAVSEWLSRLAPETPGPEALAGLMEHVREFEHGEPPGDDKTAILLRVQ